MDILGLVGSAAAALGGLLLGKSKLENWQQAIEECRKANGIFRSYARHSLANARRCLSDDFAYDIATLRKQQYDTSPLEKLNASILISFDADVITKSIQIGLLIRNINIDLVNNETTPSALDTNKQIVRYIRTAFICQALALQFLRMRLIHSFYWDTEKWIPGSENCRHVNDQGVPFVAVSQDGNFEQPLTDEITTVKITMPWWARVHFKILDISKSKFIANTFSSIIFSKIQFFQGVFLTRNSIFDDALWVSKDFSTYDRLNANHVKSLYTTYYHPQSDPYNLFERKLPKIEEILNSTPY